MKRAGCSIVRMLMLGIVVCLFIAGQVAKADYVFGEPTPISPPVNDSKITIGASISADGLEIYYDTYVFQPGYGFKSIMVATRATPSDEWGNAQLLGLEINGGFLQQNPRISADGLELYFDCVRDGQGGIYRARRQSPENTWEKSVYLEMLNELNEDVRVGSLSADGLELYYCKDGVLQVATRVTKDSDWQPTVFPGPAIINCWGAAISPGGRFLIFATDSLPGGEGKTDLWMSRRENKETDWGPPVHLGKPLNSPNEERNPVISYDGTTILFYSARPGGYGMGDIWQIPILSGGDFARVPGTALNPVPKDKTLDLPYYETILSWEASLLAESHDLYVGLSSGEIENATTDSTTYLGRQRETTHVLDGLEFGQTYYWRVDEVNAAPDSTVFTGKVWRFTVEPVAKPIETVVATASAANPNMGASNTVNGSGLDEQDRHSTTPSDMWLTDTTGSWIQYEFDKVYSLHEMWVWNSNQVVEPFIGFGVKDVVIETSVDGTAWTQITPVAPFAQASGALTYAANTIVDLSGIVAKYVKIAPQSGHGITGQSGLSEVRFFYIPTAARKPNPTDGIVVDDLNVTLTWHAGREAVSHEVYLSTDIDSVANGTAIVGTVTEPGHVADSLSYGATYYWNIVEVNTTETPAAYASDIWRFTTPEYAVIDDFESYSAKEGQEVFMTWVDGYSGDASLGGSTTGHIDSPFIETSIVNNGRKSMPIFYDNGDEFINFDGSLSSPTFSEVRRAFDPVLDLTIGSAQSLALSFRGTAQETNGRAGRNDPDPLYLTVEDRTGNTVTVMYPDPIAIQSGTWQDWLIPMTEFDSLVYTGIKSIAIGVGYKDGSQTGSEGILYIDDLRMGTPFPTND
jgi:hypothetical protein